jgi:DNA-binding HxlR family transcriptional regulator
MESIDPAKPSKPEAEALAQELLARIADKWTLWVIETLAKEGELRFSRLQERITGISQKMLTKTLRQLERDGLLTRHVHAVVPPRVDYKLTPLGESLGEAACTLWFWIENHYEHIADARHSFDQKTKQ